MVQELWKRGTEDLFTGLKITNLISLSTMVIWYLFWFSIYFLYFNFYFFKAYNLDSDSGKIGEEFLANIEPVSAIIPYVVTPGNFLFIFNISLFTFQINVYPI